MWTRWSRRCMGKDSPTPSDLGAFHRVVPLLGEQRHGLPGFTDNVLEDMAAELVAQLPALCAAVVIDARYCRAG